MTTPEDMTTTDEDTGSVVNGLETLRYAASKGYSAHLAPGEVLQVLHAFDALTDRVEELEAELADSEDADRAAQAYARLLEERLGITRGQEPRTART